MWAVQEEQALKTLIPDAAAICEQALRDAGIAPNAEATAAAAALPTPSVVEQPGKAAAPAEKLQVGWTAQKSALCWASTLLSSRILAKHG